MGVVAKMLGMEAQPKSYYEMHKTYYQPPPEVDRIVMARDGACERVTKLSARSFIGWIGAGFGVVGAGLTVFSMVALWKGDPRFEKEVATPMREAVRRLYQS